jgi:hypothetical protein
VILAAVAAKLELADVLRQGHYQSAYCKRMAHAAVVQVLHRGIPKTRVIDLLLCFSAFRSLSMYIWPCFRVPPASSWPFQQQVSAAGMHGSVIHTTVEVVLCHGALYIRTLGLA